MPGENDNILFSSEFDGEGINKGLDGLIEKLTEVKQAQSDLRKEVSNTNKELVENNKKLIQTKEALAKASDPAQIKKLQENIKILSENNVILANNLKQASNELTIVQKGVAFYNKEVNESIKVNQQASKSFKDLFNIKKQGGEIVRSLTNDIKAATFGLVSGFVGGIVAQVIPTIIDFVGELFKARKELSELEKRQKIVSEINHKAVESYAGQISKIEIFRRKLLDLNNSQNDRIKLAKEYNKTADEANKIDTKQINNIDLINDKIKAQTELIKKRATARAFEAILAQKAEAMIKAQLDLQEAFPEFTLNEEFFKKVSAQGPEIFFSQLPEKLKNTLKARFARNPTGIIQTLNNAINSQAEFNRTLSAGLGIVDIEGITGPEKTKTEKAKTEKEKEIKGMADKLMKATLDFLNKRKAIIEKVEGEITDLQLQAETKRIENLEAGFEKERMAIENAFTVAEASLTKAREKMIDEISGSKVLTGSEKEEKSAIITALFGNISEENLKIKIKRLTDLSFRIFNDSVERAREIFEDSLLADSEATTKEIKDKTDLFLKGKISYAEYQKELTKILKEEAKRRRELVISELENELFLIQGKKKQTTDQGQLKELTERENSIREKLSGLRRQSSEGEAESKGKGESPVDRLLKYANAIVELGNTVVDFWQRINQAEAAALDRSIALQQKRVENARLIAEKGNAEYLELEQQRLDELERKREENARKQLAINNALTLSQAIVAAIGAIASAVQTSGPAAPFAAIAAVGAVVAAIGAAYSFVNSLQPVSAGFFEGSEYIDGAGRPLGKDTVPARLHIGERVVTSKDNQDYWETLTAIHNHKIPPDIINRFVETYPNGLVPMIDFDRLKNATDGNMGFDSKEVVSKFDTLNESVQEVKSAIARIGIALKFDEDGFSASLSSYTQKESKRLRS